MLSAGRLSYLATTTEAFALATHTSGLEKSLFNVGGCLMSKTVKLLFYIDREMAPETADLIQQKIQDSVTNGVAQQVYDEFYGQYLSD
jgi:hypothetical protein